MKERKGLRIKVLSGSFPDTLLNLSLDDFVSATVSLHNNDGKKLKIIKDLWKNANPTTKLPKESSIENSGIREESAISGGGFSEGEASTG